MKGNSPIYWSLEDTAIVFFATGGVATKYFPSHGELQSNIVADVLYGVPSCMQSTSICIDTLSVIWIVGNDEFQMLP